MGQIDGSQLHGLSLDMKPAGPCGAPGTKAYEPHCFVRNKLPSASLTFPEFQKEVQTVANQEREGMPRPGRSSLETTVQPWGRVLVPPQRICVTIPLSASAELKPLTN